MRTLIRKIFLLFYYGCAYYLPGSPGDQIRALCCRPIFKHMGKGVIIKRGVVFGDGSGISIGDESQIGYCDTLYVNDLTIGKYVLIGPHVAIIDANHRFDRLDIPIKYQGYKYKGPIIIEDDVFIGANVTILSGVRIGTGVVVGAGAVVNKDVPPFAVVGGVPATVIKYRQ
ncbi:MAG: acetyltransferase [Desulfobacterota bacterium]|nr:acetyltransferase [Thermodesulfobacteriota bacterium]